MLADGGDCGAETESQGEIDANVPPSRRVRRAGRSIGPVCHAVRRQAAGTRPGLLAWRPAHCPRPRRQRRAHRLLQTGQSFSIRFSIRCKNGCNKNKQIPLALLHKPCRVQVFRNDQLIV